MTKIREFLLKYWLPAVIVILTVAARIYHPTLQSLWFDELYSMTVASPEQLPSDILTDLRTDFHPPLYYLMLNLLFKFVSYTDFAGRMISAAAGCYTIWLVFLLGKRMSGEKSGLVLALFFSVFFYHIKYSQEIRMYIFLFGLAIGSTLLFMKYLFTHRPYHMFLYTVVTTLTLYTQYYGFFILLAQSVCILHLHLAGGATRKLFNSFIPAWIAMLLLYAPWIPRLLQTAGTTHFMQQPAPWYFFEYLYEYTGKEPVTTLFILIGLALYIKAYASNKHTPGLVRRSFRLLILYSGLSVFVVTWLVSISIPVLSKHSTIAGLPFLMVMVFTGYYSIQKGKHLRWILPVIVVANIVNLLFVNQYYTKPVKENFRGIIAEVKRDNPYGQNMVVVSQLDRFYNYYFDQLYSPLEARNPNLLQPSEIPYRPGYIVVINAPFTKVTTPRLEPVDALGYRILNPRLLPQADSAQYFLGVWNQFLHDHYTIDAIYHDPMTQKEVAYRFKEIPRRPEEIPGI